MAVSRIDLVDFQLITAAFPHQDGKKKRQRDIPPFNHIIKNTGIKIGHGELVVSAAACVFPGLKRVVKDIDSLLDSVRQKPFDAALIQTREESGYPAQINRLKGRVPLTPFTRNSALAIFNKKCL